MFQNPFRQTALIDQVLVLAKPDAVHNGKVGRILAMFERTHFWICNTRELQMTNEFCAQHYRDHVNKPFYPSLVDFMTSGLTIAFHMQWVSNPKDMIPVARETVEAIRQINLCQNPRNLVHASSSIEAAQRELTLWFPNSKN